MLPKPRLFKSWAEVALSLGSPTIALWLTGFNESISSDSLWTLQWAGIAPTQSSPLFNHLCFSHALSFLRIFPPISRPLEKEFKLVFQSDGVWQGWSSRCDPQEADNTKNRYCCYACNNQCAKHPSTFRVGSLPPDRYSQYQSQFPWNIRTCYDKIRIFHGHKPWQSTTIQHIRKALFGKRKN